MKTKATSKERNYRKHGYGLFEVILVTDEMLVCQCGQKLHTVPAQLLVDRLVADQLVDLDYLMSDKDNRLSLLGIKFTAPVFYSTLYSMDFQIDMRNAVIYPCPSGEKRHHLSIESDNSLVGHDEEERNAMEDALECVDASLRLPAYFHKFADDLDDDLDKELEDEAHTVKSPKKKKLKKTA